MGQIRLWAVVFFRPLIRSDCFLCDALLSSKHYYIETTCQWTVSSKLNFCLTKCLLLYHLSSTLRFLKFCIAECLILYRLPITLCFLVTHQTSLLYSTYIRTLFLEFGTGPYVPSNGCVPLSIHDRGQMCSSNRTRYRMSWFTYD